MKLPKHLHVVGICGVATSALAIAFHDRGVKVTGSDKGFFPPVSTELSDHGIAFYAGWHPEKMTAHGDPDVVMVGTASGSKNPETVYADNTKIQMFSYPEIIGQYFAKSQSIVCVGTWGKTSSAALLSHILIEAKVNPTYMFGGISLSHEASAKLTDANVSVFEGDEYKSSPTDDRAKFFHYKPTHLLLTAVSWDHADLYPTEADYFGAFTKLIATLPKNGYIVACADHAGAQKVLGSYSGKKIMYGKSSGGMDLDYSYDITAETKDGLDLTIGHGNNTWNIHSPMLGNYQAENIAGCFAMAHSMGISAEKIVRAIGTFRGLKRRLEKRADGDVTILDDIAHSPEKAKSVLATLRTIYTGKIIAIFEPNIGGRKREASSKYDNAFGNADLVVIPRLTKLKVGDDEKDPPIEGPELARTIARTHPNVKNIEDDTALVDFILADAQKGDVIVFLGSHGFRGMIEEIISPHQRSQS